MAGEDEDNEGLSEWPNPQEERGLTRRAQAGDQNAYAILWKHHERLAWKLVWKMVSQDSASRSKIANDLFSAAKVGFCEALRRFDLDKYENRLVTYAKWWMQLEIEKSIEDETERPRPSRGSQLHTNILMVKEAQKNLCQELKREPTKEEIAEAAGLTPLDVDEALLAMPRLVRVQRERPDDPAEGVPPEPQGTGRPTEDPIHSREAYRFVAEEAGTKYLILFLLRDEGGLTTPEIIPLFRCPSCPGMDSFWSEFGEHYTLMELVPRKWASVCELFCKPPPRLVQNTINQYMVRKGRKLLAALGGPEVS
ncbi:MAG: hypothetical protein HY675_06920 [Chloroflexi bacterium]|nr:hypothetical protein [Chloroflexota bacterium]